MEGTTKTAFIWVHPSDENRPEDKQTKWHLTPLGGYDGARIRKMYAESESAGRKGTVKVNENKALQADKAMWLKCVSKVENFKFSVDHPELHKQGFIAFDDEATLRLCGGDVDMDQFNDIIEAASSAGRQDDNSRKK